MPILGLHLCLCVRTRKAGPHLWDSIPELFDEIPRTFDNF